MEPSNSSTPSIAELTNSVTPELTAAIKKAVEAIPKAHRRRPVQDEVVESVEAGYIRLQDWAFTQHFALAQESGGKQVYFRCTHYQKKTRNSRQTDEKNRRHS